MSLEPKTIRRRWFGVFSLGAALLMLVAGETVLDARLRGWGFLCYWLGCLLLTCFSVLVALRDARALRMQTRQEERALLERTIKEVENRARTGQPRRNAGPSAD